MTKKQKYSFLYVTNSRSSKMTLRKHVIPYSNIEYHMITSHYQYWRSSQNRSKNTRDIIANQHRGTCQLFLTSFYVLEEKHLMCLFPGATMSRQRPLGLRILGRAKTHTTNTRLAK